MAQINSSYKNNTSSILKINSPTYDEWVSQTDTHNITKTKNYESNLTIHNQLRKKFPYHFDLMYDFKFSNLLYEIGIISLGLPEGQCEYKDVFFKDCKLCDKEKTYISFDKKIDKPYIKGLKSNKILNDFKTTSFVMPAHSHLGVWRMDMLEILPDYVAFERVYFKKEYDMNTLKTNLILNSLKFCVLD